MPRDFDRLRLFMMRQTSLSRGYWLLRLLAVATVSLLAAAGCGSTSRSAGRGIPPTPIRGSTTTNSSPPMTVGASSVMALQMFTPRNGVGVIGTGPPPECGNCDGPASGPYWFAITSDSGSHWTRRGRLPGSVDDQFYGQMTLAFASNGEGYLAYSVKGRQTQQILFTTDSGMTFTGVDPPAPEAGIVSLIDGSLWMGANECPAGVIDGPACRAELFIYPLGQLKPTATTTIPIDIPLSELGGPEAPRMLDRIDATTAVVTEGGEGSPTTLQITRNNGIDWQSVPDPCSELPPGGLAVVAPGTWKLYCALDGGMKRPRFDAASF